MYSSINLYYFFLEVKEIRPLSIMFFVLIPVDWDEVSQYSK